jgi:hypothetical protein
MSAANRFLPIMVVFFCDPDVHFLNIEVTCYKNTTLNSNKSFLFVRFEVFTAVTMKNAVFWGVALCRSRVNRRFGGTYCSIFRVEKPASEEPVWAGGCRFFYPEDGGNTFIRNVGSHKTYTAPHPRRQHSSCFLFPSLNTNHIEKCFW